MGRRPMNTEMDKDTQAMVLAAQSAQNEVAKKEEINARFLAEGEHYSLNVCIEKAKMFQEQMASGMLGLGAQLLLLKANEPHGNFLAAVEELGLAERSAQYAMAAAMKFGNRQTFADLGNSKLIALTVLDDDDTRDLVNGEKIEGIGNLDDISQMTVRELKNAVRQLREEKAKAEEEHAKQLEAVENVVRKKEGKISELEVELSGRQPPTKEELAKVALDDMKKQIVGVLSLANDNLQNALNIVARAQTVEGVTVDQLDEWISETSWITSLVADAYSSLEEDMENIRPMKQEG